MLHVFLQFFKFQPLLQVIETSWMDCENFIFYFRAGSWSLDLNDSHLKEIVRAELLTYCMRDHLTLSLAFRPFLPAPFYCCLHSLLLSDREPRKWLTHFSHSLSLSLFVWRSPLHFAFPTSAHFLPRLHLLSFSVFLFCFSLLLPLFFLSPTFSPLLSSSPAGWSVQVQDSPSWRRGRKKEETKRRPEKGTRKGGGKRRDTQRHTTKPAGEKGRQEQRRTWRIVFEGERMRFDRQHIVSSLSVFDFLNAGLARSGEAPHLVKKQ